MNETKLELFIWEDEDKPIPYVYSKDAKVILEDMGFMMTPFLPSYFSEEEYCPLRLMYKNLTKPD